MPSQNRSLSHRDNSSSNRSTTTTLQHPNNNSNNSSRTNNDNDNTNNKNKNNRNVKQLSAIEQRIIEYRKARRSRDIIQLFEQLSRSQREALDSSTLTTIIASCTDELALKLGRDIHKNLIIAKGGTIEIDSYLGTSLIQLYGKCGAADEAWLVFQQLLQKKGMANRPSWTRMIAAYRHSHLPHKAIELFHRMLKEGEEPPNEITMVEVVAAVADAKLLEEGINLHRLILSRGIPIDLFLGNTLIDMYGKCRAPDEALLVFESLRKRGIADVRSWSTMIASYRHSNLPNKAIQLFQQMLKEGGGVSPTPHMIVEVLAAVADAKSLEEGINIHQLILSRGIPIDAFVATTLIDMYGKWISWGSPPCIRVPPQERKGYCSIVEYDDSFLSP